MIDTHAHIYLPEFANDQAGMIQRAKDAGVKKILMPGIDHEVINDMMQLAESENGFCYAMMGLHPCSVKEQFEKELSILAQHFANENHQFVAVGECGLDYYWDKTFVPQQKEAFEFQIKLAKKLNLPIVIHSRESTDDCIAMIAQHKDENLRGVFHCFSGTSEQLEQIIDLDFYAGIGGVVTYKNGGLDKILQKRHLSHIVLETDAPYLTPVPFRGKRNEPAYLTYVTNRLAAIIGVTTDEVENITTANALKLFF